MVIYSVTINVDQEIAAEWLEWMQNQHIPDVMKTGFFENYHVQVLLEPEQPNETATFNIQYECQTRERLQQYFDHHAVALQEEHSQRYIGRFVSFRTILQRIE